MANKVYANGREVSCKAGSGKTICAFPDVCFTPPENPATPPGVPIPYPNTGFDSDTTEGSKTVKITGKEVMLKNKSYFKKSTGDEAGCAAKKGVLTSVNRGKVYFTAWSMDVKFEGENVVRHLDLTTDNHASVPGDTPPWPFAASMAAGTLDDPCEEDKEKEQAACRGLSQQQACANNDCVRARRCRLVPYGGSGSPNCCPGSTGHHMIERHWVQPRLTGANPTPAANAAQLQADFPMAQGAGNNNAPTVCLEGGRFNEDHGEMHQVQGQIEEAHMPGGGMANEPWDYGAGKSAAIAAHDAAFGDSGCDKACLEAQLDNFYGENEGRPLRPPQAQTLAVNDTQNDGRWLRDEAAESLAPLIGGG